MFKKNTAVTGFQIGHFIGIADGIAVTTGTPACKLLLDGTPGTLTNAASYDATAGVWKIDLAAGDMNGDMVGLSFTLAACLPISYTIRTGTKLVSDLNDAAASNDWSAGEREQLRYRLQIDGTQTAPADTDLPSVNVTNWKGAEPGDLDASGNVPSKLADGVVHGGLAAQLDLQRLRVINDINGGTAVLLSSASPYSAGKGVDIRGTNGGRGIDVSGLVKMDWDESTQFYLADALRLAPGAGEIETGSAYDLLANVGTGSGTVEPAQLDWHAWATPDGALADLYDDNAIDALTSSGTTLTAEGDTGFAAWVLQEFDDALFVGVGKPPMNHIAAVIGSIATAGAAPTFEYALPEEGVMAMCAGSDGKLYVAGVDERANTGDSSIYIRTAVGAWTRKQTVTGWQHICGIREDGLLWIAGQGAASVLMYSANGGDTWTDTGLTLGRANDVIRLGSRVIATHWNGVATYTIHSSLTTPAFSWSEVGLESGIGRMVEWNGVIALVSASGEVVTVDSDGLGTEYTPPFTLAQTYNNLAVDTDGYLCVLGTTGVWRTADLATWKQVWSFAPGDTVRALGTWGDELVVSTDGATAQVLARPASPEAAEQQMYRDALKLAASPGTAATGSTDADIADILTDTTAIKLITDAIDVSAVTQAPANNAGTLAFTVGVTFDETPTGMVIPVDWSECYFTLKGDKASETDSQALIQIKVTNGGDAGDGLQRLDKSALVAPVASADASLVVNQAAGTVRIIVSDDALGLLTGGRSGLEWDLKVHRSTGASKVLTTGEASIEWTPTRAV